MIFIKILCFLGFHEWYNNTVLTFGIYDECNYCGKISNVREYPKWIVDFYIKEYNLTIDKEELDNFKKRAGIK